MKQSPKILKNLSLVFSERIIQILLGIAINGMLARYFTREDFGRWQYAQTVIILVISLTWIAGNEILVPRLTDADKDSANKTLSSFFVIRSAAALLVFVLFLLVVVFAVNDERLRTLLLVFSPLILLKEPFLVLLGWFQSQASLTWPTVLNIAALLAKVAVFALLIRLGAATQLFPGGMIAESVVISVGLILTYSRVHGLQFHVDRQQLESVFWAGLKLWGSLILMYLFARVDRLFLQHTLGFTQYSLYAAATQLNENWLAITSLICTILAPILIYRTYSPVKLRKNLGLVVLVTVVASLVGCLLLSALAVPLFRMVFGEKYVYSGELFKMMTWFALPQGIDAALTLILLKVGRVEPLIVKWLVGTVICTAACALLVPRFHELGGIWSMAIGYVSVMLISAYFVYRQLGELQEVDLQHE